MKKSAMLFLLLCISAIDAKAMGGKALIVETTNGEKTAFVLAQSPIVTFSEKVLKIMVENEFTSFSLDVVKQYYFADAATGIDVVKGNIDLRITYQGDNLLVVDGLDEKEHIDIYDMNGIRSNVSISRVGSRAEISLATLSKGVYIAKIGNKQNFKIHRK